MERQGIVVAVWLLRRRRDSLDREFDPVVSIGVDNENLAVEIQKGIQTRIARSSLHVAQLSRNDNRVKILQSPMMRDNWAGSLLALALPRPVGGLNQRAAEPSCFF